MKNKLVLLTLILGSFIFSSCDKEDSDSPGTEKIFMKFTYEKKNYNWQFNIFDATTIMYWNGNIPSTITAQSFKDGKSNLLTITNRTGKFEAGVAYDIMSTEKADILITFSSMSDDIPVSGDIMAESFSSGTNVKVGEIKITSDKNGVLTGTFHCKMLNDFENETSITNGSFKAVTWEEEGD